MLGILLFMYFGWAAMDKGQPLRHAGICVALATALSLLVYRLVDRWRDQIFVPRCS